MKNEYLFNSAIDTIKDVQTDTNQLEETSSEDFLIEEETANLLSDIAATVCPELEKSERLALDVTRAVDQIVKLSDRDQYQKAMETIFSDPALSTKEKLQLKAEEDNRQNIKVERATERVIHLQESQTKSILEVIKTYGLLIGLGLGGVSAIFLFGSKSGRTLLSKAIALAGKEAPKNLVMKRVA